VCACADKLPAITAAKDQCGLARALPDTIETLLQTAASTESKRLDVLQAQDAVRKVVKECIEETAKLPGLGCS
jgi:hypothetical protein